MEITLKPFSDEITTPVPDGYAVVDGGKIAHGDMVFCVDLGMKTGRWESVSGNDVGKKVSGYHCIIRAIA